nr:MAG TPA: hypothetical protein [Caudoviricetes sp.]
MLLIYAPVIQALDNFNLGLLRKHLDRSLLYRFHSRNVGVKIRHTITSLMVCLPPGDFDLLKISQIQVHSLDFGLGEQLVCDVDTPNFLILALALAAIHGFVVGFTLSTIKQHFSYLSLLIKLCVATPLNECRRFIYRNSNNHNHCCAIQNKFARTILINSYDAAHQIFHRTIQAPTNSIESRELVQIIKATTNLNPSIWNNKDSNCDPDGAATKLLPFKHPDLLRF